LLGNIVNKEETSHIFHALSACECKPDKKMRKNPPNPNPIAVLIFHIIKEKIWWGAMR
jgi:hypothetical protein